MQEKREPGFEIRKRQNFFKEFISALIGDKTKANERLVNLIAGLAFGIAGYFLGKCNLLFSTYPFGIALLSSATRHIPFILTGMCISGSATVINPAVAVTTYIMTVAVRVFIRIVTNNARKQQKQRTAQNPTELAEKLRKSYAELFCESVYLRMITSVIAAFCLSLYACISGGFRYYDLFGAFFAIIAAPVATFLFSSYFEKDLKETKLHEIGVLALLVAVIYAIRELTFFGVYIGAFVAFFATLCIGRRRGILYGCLTGLCLGLAFKPIYAPLFILEAAAAGVLWNVSALAAATAGCVVGMIWGVYVNGMSALSQLLPALLCGAMSFGAADKLSLITGNPELIKVKTEDRTALEIMVREQINNSDESCMRQLSGMFSELAESFYNLSDRLRRPGALDLRRMCDKVFDRYCEACPRREVCWGVEYASTLDILNHITADLHMKAGANIQAVPEYLRTRCAAMPQMISEINDNCAKLTEHALMCDRTGVFALDYEGISHILSDALESGRADYIIDETAAAEVSEMLKKLRFSFVGVIAYGGRRKSVAVKGLDASRAKINIKDLKEKLNETVGVSFGDPVFTPVGNKFDMTVSTKRSYTAISYTSQMTAVSRETAQNTVCGDTVAEFENKNDYTYTLLSDGMGAGREAAFTSRICSMFLEKMLAANNRSETALRLLNSFMSERDGGARHECSATVDLLEFDAITGQMSVLKSGAAPTYVKRGSNCFKLKSNTVPLGIIETPDIQRLRFDAEAGDRVIMISDGVMQSREDCAWLVNLISSEWDCSSSDMAKRIVGRAREEGSEDDITAVIIEIEETDAMTNF